MNRYLVSIAVAAVLTLSACSGGGTPQDAPPPVTGGATDTATQPADSTTTSDPTETAATGSASAPASTSTGDDGQPAEDTDLAQHGFEVTAEDAVATATGSTGDGIVHKVNLEYSRHHSAWIYKVEVLVGQTDHEVAINAVTGDMLADEQDSEDDQQQAIDLSVMPVDEAMQKALAVQPGTVAEWTLEWENGRQLYVFDVRKGNDTVDVSVEPATGKAQLGDD